jgi:hypothetical protein
MNYRMKGFLLFISVLLCLIFFTGCVSTNQDTLSANIETGELSGHVNFLAQPALKGRKSLSTGSRLAREYIARQFKSYGLVPWGNAKSYMQSFVAGTNVIGVLPGSDPNLKDEFVIVCAHYDHLGKTKENGMCLGACDNASGVAALLEIAETLSLSKVKPKRSICFAAFDCEEIALLGAFAFSVRPDFDDSKIAGIVNIDQIGQIGYEKEVLGELLTVTGIEDYLPLFKDVKQECSNIQLLPVINEIFDIGDTFPFKLIDCPVLWFSNGPYKDYHKNTDTADKLDYTEMLKTTNIILHTVNVIANQQERFEEKITIESQREILLSYQACLEKIIAEYTKLGMTQTQDDSMKVLLDELIELQKKDIIDSQSRRILLLTNYVSLLPMLEWASFSDNSNKLLNDQLLQYLKWETYLLSSDFYPEIIGMGRAFAKHLEKYSHSRFFSGIPEFSYSVRRLPDNYISLTNIDKDTYCLIYAITSIQLKISQINLLTLFNKHQINNKGSFYFNHYVIKGTKEEIIDNCMMRWRIGELEKKEDPESIVIEEDEHWQKILSIITETTMPKTYEQWLEYRLSQGPWQTEKQWVLHNIQSTNRDVAEPAIDLIKRLLPEQAEQALVTLISNKSLSPNIRAEAIRALNNVGSSTLLSLAELLDDGTECWLGMPDIPKACLDSFIGIVVKYSQYGYLTSNSGENTTFKTNFNNETISKEALMKLKMLTGQDFKKDKQKWVLWIQEHEDKIFINRVKLKLILKVGI